MNDSPVPKHGNRQAHTVLPPKLMQILKAFPTIQLFYHQKKRQVTWAELKNVPAAQQTGGESDYDGVSVEGICELRAVLWGSADVIYWGQNEECLWDANESSKAASLLPGCSDSPFKPRKNLQPFCPLIWEITDVTFFYLWSRHDSESCQPLMNAVWAP